MSALDERLNEMGIWRERVKEQAQYLESNTAELRTLVREARVRGANISELSRAAGVSRPTIYQWLREDSK